MGGTHSDRELIATFGDRGAGRDLRAELDRRPADLVLRAKGLRAGRALQGAAVRLMTSLPEPNRPCW